MQTEFRNLREQIHSIARIMFDSGVGLMIGRDLGEFKRYAEQQPDKGHLHPAFDIDEPGNRDMEGLWIIGRRRNGEIVHTQAIKLIDLGDRSFGEYLKRNVSEYRSHGYDFDLDRTDIFLTDAAARMSGRITYHGELWLKGGPDGIRGGSNVILLTRLMLLVAMQVWAPDYMFGLQSPMTACRGLSTREGYSRCEQQSIVWYPSDGSSPEEDWLVWMSAEDASFNLRLPPEFFVSLFEKRADRVAKTQRLVA